MGKQTTEGAEFAVRRPLARFVGGVAWAALMIVGPWVWSDEVRVGAHVGTENGQLEASGEVLHSRWGVVRIVARGGAHPVAEAIALGGGCDGSMAMASSSNVAGGIDQSEQIAYRRDSVGRQYGVALHQLWAGNYDAAVAGFCDVLKSEADNPLVLYYLALSCRRGGDPATADKVLKIATQSEITRPLPGWGRLMQRVQGPDRTSLESARSNAGLGPCVVVDRLAPRQG